MQPVVAQRALLRPPVAGPAINGSGKDELACRSGWTYGTFVKRIATVGWAASTMAR